MNTEEALEVINNTQSYIRELEQQNSDHLAKIKELEDELNALQPRINLNEVFQGAPLPTGDIDHDLDACHKWGLSKYIELPAIVSGQYDLVHFVIDPPDSIVAVLQEVYPSNKALEQKNKQLQGVVEAANELMELKKYKDKNGKTVDYQTQRPVLWVRLEEALQSLQESNK